MGNINFLNPIKVRFIQVQFRQKITCSLNVTIPFNYLKMYLLT